MWYISLDYVNHQTCLTADQARTDPDGMMRFVISERDPGLANWLECTGHQRGYVQIRWQRLSRDLGPEDGPRVEVVPFDELPRLLPYYQQARVTPAEHARGSPPARPPSPTGCSADGAAGGQGGRGLRRRAGPGPVDRLASARAGADLVLAARTASRLDEVAKDVTALGAARSSSRPTSTTTRRPRGWPTRRWPSSAGSTRW